MQDSFFNQPEYKQPEFDENGHMVYSVEECVFLINEAVGRLGAVKVRGEISNLGISKGVMAFFDLKDASGKEHVVQCSLFSWKFSKFKHLLADGMEVIVTGKFKVYEKRGSLSLVVEEMEPAGVGAWRRAFEALKKKLEAKGYFNQERKRPIPEIIRTIGLITSEDGQALHDFRQNLGQYGFRVFLKSVWVEGEKSEQSIIQALRLFSKRASSVDVIVLIRGGGGFENLKTFHLEAIAEEIVASRIPVITGIGHEKDESIADYVADYQCSTPTAVATFLTQRHEELMRTVDSLWNEVEEKTKVIVQEQKDLLVTQKKELEVSMERIFARERFAVSQNAEKLHRGLGRIFEGFAHMRHRLERARYKYEQTFQTYVTRVEKAQIALASLNPENVLQRGYSVVFTTSGKVLKSSADVAIGDKVFIRLHKGKLGTKVEEK